MRMKETMREYPKRPLIGTGAIIIEGDKILLVKRAYDPNKGLWSIPGGLVRLGETLEEALKREVKEETGVEIEVGDVAFVGEEIFRFNGIRYHYIIIDFLARIRSGELKAGSDAEEVRWFHFDELDNAVEFVRRIVEKIRSGEKKIYLK